MTRVVSRLGPRGYSFSLGSLWQRGSEQLPSGHGCRDPCGGREAGREGPNWRPQLTDTGVEITRSVVLAGLAVASKNNEPRNLSFHVGRSQLRRKGTKGMLEAGDRVCLLQDSILSCRVELPTPTPYPQPYHTPAASYFRMLEKEPHSGWRLSKVVGSALGCSCQVPQPLRPLPHLLTLHLPTSSTSPPLPGCCC